MLDKPKLQAKNKLSNSLFVTELKSDSQTCKLKEKLSGISGAECNVSKGRADEAVALKEQREVITIHETLGYDVDIRKIAVCHKYFNLKMVWGFPNSF